MLYSEIMFYSKVFHCNSQYPLNCSQHGEFATFLLQHLLFNFFYFIPIGLQGLRVDIASLLRVHLAPNMLKTSELGKLT